jgi:hypothetical protein
MPRWESLKTGKSATSLSARTIDPGSPTPAGQVRSMPEPGIRAGDGSGHRPTSVRAEMPDEYISPDTVRRVSPT